MSTPELDQLRQELQSIREECEALRQQVSELQPTSSRARDAGSDAVPASTVSSRRTAFKLAAGAVAGGAAALAVSGGRAAATDNVAPLIGNTSTQGTSGRTRTTFDYTNPNGPQQTNAIGTFDANIFLVRDRFTSSLSEALLARDASDFPAAVAGYGYRAVDNGVYGLSGKPGGYGVVGAAGAGATGMLARGARANIELPLQGSAPPNRADAHRQGELVHDQNGDLWLCTAAGTPGTWTKLAGQKTSGAFHAIAPKRIYDSRPDTSPFLPPKARINPGENRLIDCTQNASGVPAAARAILLNLTAAGPTGKGNLAVYPDGTAPPSASTINYSAGVNIANSTIVACGPGAKIRVACGGSSGVDFIIDISGYFR
jgi:hypothetical protein